MSLAHTHKLNSLYSHTRSVEERAPAPEITPIGKLKQEHYEEARKLGLQQQIESNKLADRHQTERNADPIGARLGMVHEEMANRHTDEQKKQSAKFRLQTQDMKTRQHLAMERALKVHGTAP